MKQMFPQAGIITSFDGKKAKVFLPLFKLETSWIRVCSNLLEEADILLENPVIVTETTTLDGNSGTISKMSFQTLKVGDEVLVVFLNGDLNDGVVTNRIG